ncbi:MAG: DNA replication/repair protein RecF [Bacteroidales bacterium]|nr:DNA replication/repair protein RecF [Bacteroidales bacterium]
MYIENLKLNNFKNFSEFEHDFSQINCIVGNNGVGKTNILDAVYYLSFCKSFNSSNDLHTMKHGEDYFALFGKYILQDGTKETFSCSQKKEQKKILKHGKNTYKKFSQHIGKLPCVMVSPNDQIYILGHSEVRRKFMDMILSQVDVVYMENLINYNRSLEQKNKLLKTMQQNQYFDYLQLEIWNEKLDKYSSVIQQKRKDFFNEFKEPFNYFYNYISSDKEFANLEYKTYDGKLLDILQNNAEKERYTGYTSEGIHKDDIIFYLNEHNVHFSGSQGQQKTFVLALKLAQYDYLKKHKETTPILLLDDIFDKFDFSRVEKILSLVAQDSFGQVFLTDTHLSRVKEIIPENKKKVTTIIEL